MENKELKQRSNIWLSRLSKFCEPNSRGLETETSEILQYSSIKNNCPLSWRQKGKQLPMARSKSKVDIESLTRSATLSAKVSFWLSFQGKGRKVQHESIGLSEKLTPSTANTLLPRHNTHTHTKKKKQKMTAIISLTQKRKQCKNNDPMNQLENQYLQSPELLRSSELR